MVGPKDLVSKEQSVVQAAGIWVAPLEIRTKSRCSLCRSVDCSWSPMTLAGRNYRVDLVPVLISAFTLADDAETRSVRKAIDCRVEGWTV